MIKSLIGLFLIVFSVSARATCPLPWVCEKIKLAVPYTSMKGVRFSLVSIRGGYLPHQGEFKGNILYFQGLGDSMLNHDPLFKKLAQEGYRVIAFDYMGQGGSTGSMNKTRIEYIPWIGERVWNRFAFRKNDFQEKTIIGWSTGGLAAYLSASKSKADKVILIAPGIAPRKIVGEGIFNKIPNEITLETLTTDVYFDQSSNPHRDAIKPNTPFKVPEFSANLLITAKKIQKVRVPEYVKGMMLLSGENDTYVNAEKSRKIVRKNAPHFSIRSYEGALHEIDNERPEIREEAHRDILDFLNNLR
ncbi:MAG: alpha/beta hydrolase [Bacteriovoracia bacterium]